MEDVWNRIETWLRANAPETLRDLRSGATRDDIRAAEAALGVSFPDDMVASYLRHDGQDHIGYALMGQWQLLPLEHLVIQGESMRDLPPDEEAGEGEDEGAYANPVRQEWWNPRWVPVAYDGGGDLRCVDLDPTPYGTMGQVMTFWHTDERRERLALSFREWLNGFADDLEQGRYAVQDGEVTEVERSHS